MASGVFEQGNPFFQSGQAFLALRQQGRLDFELLAGDQIEPGQAAGQECAGIFFEITNGAAGQPFGKLSGDVVKQCRIGHVVRARGSVSARYQESASLSADQADQTDHRLAARLRLVQGGRAGVKSWCVSRECAGRFISNQMISFDYLRWHGSCIAGFADKLQRYLPNLSGALP